MRDLHSYLNSAVLDTTLLSEINWDEYKWSIVDQVEPHRPPRLWSVCRMVLSSCVEVHSPSQGQ